MMRCLVPWNATTCFSHEDAVFYYFFGPRRGALGPSALVPVRPGALSNAVVLVYVARTVR
jgi:hypothetical protein